jgi:transcriptional regulator with XRE-family HTH domain
MAVSERIKNYMEKNNISQSDLSKVTHIALPKLNLALNGKRRMTFEEFALILGATNTTADMFITPVPLPGENQFNDTDHRDSA